ncbi:MAG: hypothetical protein LC137_07955 [Burkholderiales bacterium]|nr:hypothetical protein [Burkholderiales bacterium]
MMVSKINQQLARIRILFALWPVSDAAANFESADINASTKHDSLQNESTVNKDREFCLRCGSFQKPPQISNPPI